MKHYPPPEPTSYVARLMSADPQLADVHSEGGYTAVQAHVERRLGELDREDAEVPRWPTRPAPMTQGEYENWLQTISPERREASIRLNLIVEEMRHWDILLTQIAGYVANEELGWTIQSDGTPAKVQSNGRVLSVPGYVSEFVDSDGRTYTSNGPGEAWERRHKTICRQFGERVRMERLARARRTMDSMSAAGRVAPRRRGSGRPRAQATRSSAKSGDSGDDSDPAGLRHIAEPLERELAQIADRLRAKGGVG